MGADYLKAMHAEGQSAWSIATAAAALNKAMGWDLSPAALGLPSRRKADIARSRIPRVHDNRDFSAFADQIAMGQGHRHTPAVHAGHQAHRLCAR